MFFFLSLSDDLVGFNLVFKVILEYQALGSGVFQAKAQPPRLFCTGGLSMYPSLEQGWDR